MKKKHIEKSLGKCILRFVHCLKKHIKNHLENTIYFLCIVSAQNVLQAKLRNWRIVLLVNKKEQGNMNSVWKLFQVHFPKLNSDYNVVW